MLRLSKKHAAESEDAQPRPDPRRILADQSPVAAVTAGCVTVILLCFLWTALTVLTGRVFPWFPIVQGAVIGRTVRRWGRGFDYRFPLIAVVLALAGALLGNLMIALPETAEQLGANAFQVVRGLTWRSIEIFLAEVITPVDCIYAGFAAALAAFFSTRRLNRHEVFALRNMNGDRSP